jgi:predicted RNA binding protein YcfA (HicA-like mRNA interferase family)
LRRGTEDELYDLEADPSERTNVAGQEAETAAQLAAIAERDDAPRVAMAAPALRVRANGLEDTRTLRTDGPTPLLVLDPGDVEDDGRSWPQRLEAPELVATLNGPELVRAERSHLRFDRDGHDHVVVPSHPALAVFGRSFSLRAVLRVGRLAERGDPDERQWLVLAKATGVHDDSASFGLLVQGGDLGCAAEGPHSCTGREIVVVFGDPRFDPARPIVLASTITIDDDALHEIVLHVDRESGRLELVLDERRESIPFFVSPGIGAEAPIVIGAHHDARGRFEHGFAGELHRFVLAEGHASDRDLRRLQRSSAPRHVRVELGEVDVGATPRVLIELESLPLPGAHWVSTEVELDRDVRATLDGPARGVLFGGDRAELGVRLEPSREGRFAADLTVRALRGRSGTLVEGAPVRVHVRGTVRARLSAPRTAEPSVLVGLARGLGLGAAIVSFLVSVAAWRARRVR